ncbi:unnamed protein product [Microthlaspi erraticum]|uniref:Transposase, Ptta/En/Spm, plant n=1 Tax=Microthlaspi erraticum TaxID=1685480 RepID=A0A6D2JIP6_9BRAS|nr:unnamed protein product [Microthlaspi erraticum]
MAGFGKSQKGRGGISGGMGQSPIPETIPPRGSTLAPQASPRGSASHPQPIHPQPLRPPPYVPPQWTPPPYNPPPEGPETDAEPMEDQFPEQAQPPPHQDPPMSIHDLLQTPGRADYLPILDPLPTANTIWFDRDDGKLVRKISKILKSKFDGPYYCWTKTPPYVQDRCFIAFAQAYHWDPLVHSLVEDEFKAIALNRMKDMVSKARTKRVRPSWIGETLWESMCAYWSTEEAKARSSTASNAIKFPKDGLGKRIHRSGQKSYSRIQRDMEKELGRPVSIGEVFIRTHTLPDGSFVDPKPQQIAETYEKNLEDEMSQLMDDETDCSSELTTAAKDNVFLKSTVTDDRGQEFGLGSLRRHYGNGKRKRGAGTSTVCAISEMQEQLQAAQRKIEEQAAAIAARQVESAKQLDRIGNLEMVLS